MKFNKDKKCQICNAKTNRTVRVANYYGEEELYICPRTACIEAVKNAIRLYNEQLEEAGLAE